MTADPDDVVRIFEWTRSQDPGFTEIGDAANTGSGVDFYNLLITGPINIVTTADDNAGLCPADLCRFITPKLVPGLYDIRVTAVDRATNESLSAAADFTAGSKVVVQNLKVLDTVGGPELVNTVNGKNPRFQWRPPLELPNSGDEQGGIETYEIAITGDFQTSPFTIIEFTSFTDSVAFITECSDGVNATGDECKKFIQSGDEIRITVSGDLPDGTHLLTVSVIDESTGFSRGKVLLFFVVDTTPPTPPGLVAPDDALRTNDISPLFDWDASTSGDVASYRLQVVSGDINTGSLVLNVVVLHPATQFQTTGELADGDYQWRVLATDKALNETTTGGLEVLNFTIDTVPPAPPALVSVAGDTRVQAKSGDTTPLFEWAASTSDDIASYRLQVTTGGINTGPYVINKVILHPTTSDLTTVPLAEGTYSWRVGAKDVAGNEAATGDLEVRTFEIDTTPPSPPTLAFPLNDILLINRTVELSWSASVSADIEGYRLQVFSGDINTGLLVVNVELGAADLGVRRTLPSDATYSWQVLARDDVGNVTPTAGLVVRTFIVDLTPVTALVKTVTDDVDTPSFDWESTLATVGVDFHRVHIESDSFIDITVPPTPTLLSPADGKSTSDDTPTFRWNRVVDDISIGSGLTYILEIATGDQPVTADFKDPVFRQVGISGDEATLQITLVTGEKLATGDYIWHVRAVDRSGNIGDFSEAFIFAVVVDQTPPGIPTLLTPASGDVTNDTTPSFTWTEVTDDVSGVTYTLEIASGDQPTTGAFTNPVFATGDITETKFTLDTGDGLVVDGDYIWHVRAQDVSGNLGDFSDPFRFTVDTAPPSAPVAVRPATGDQVKGPLPTFIWEQVSDATAVTYTLEIAFGDSGEFNVTVFTGDGIPDDPATGDEIHFKPPAPGLVVTRDCIWHVRAVDAAGNTGDFFAAVRFTVTGDDEPPSAPALISPRTGDEIEGSSAHL